jgi:hypothetical protein
LRKYLAPFTENSEMNLRWYLLIIVFITIQVHLVSSGDKDTAPRQVKLGQTNEGCITAINEKFAYWPMNTATKNNEYKEFMLVTYFNHLVPYYSGMRFDLIMICIELGE